MNLMVPMLAAYIAESIGKRPALVPGFVAGMIAIQGLPVNPATGLIDAGGSGVGFGFLGGIVGGFLAGYVILLLEKVFAKLPANLNGLKAIFLYPLFSTLIVGLVMLGISGPMVTINNAMMDFLRSLQHAGAIPLGIAIGCMCAVDMGGPVNKAAYVTGTMLLGAGLEAPRSTPTAPRSWLPFPLPASFRRWSRVSPSLPARSTSPRRTTMPASSISSWAARTSLRAPFRS